MARFDGDVVLVTGGARGIGRATVERFALEGAQVAFCDVDEDVGAQAAGAIGHDVRSYRCDVGVEAEVAALVSRCTAELGAPTVLVNNAGVNANFDLAEMTSDEWDAFFAVDLKAAWLTTKHTVPAMRAAGRGAIVNVSSIHGFTTIVGFFPYAAAKSGLIGLTRTMAWSWARTGSASTPSARASPARGWSRRRSTCTPIGRPRRWRWCGASPSGGWASRPSWPRPSPSSPPTTRPT